MHRLKNSPINLFVGLKRNSITIEFVESSDGGKWSVRPKTNKMMQQNSSKSVWCNFTVTVQSDDDYVDVQSDQADEDYQAALSEADDPASSFYSDEENEEIEDEDMSADNSAASTPSATQPRPPTFTRQKKMEILSYMVKPAGSTVTYKCPADGKSNYSSANRDYVGELNNVLAHAGFPKPDIAWTKDGGPIKRHLGSAKMQKWSLELEGATTYDSGNYTCTVTNAHGTVSFTYKLLIQGKTVFFSRFAYVTLGALEKLRCSL